MTSLRGRPRTLQGFQREKGRHASAHKARLLLSVPAASALAPITPLARASRHHHHHYPQGNECSMLVRKSPRDRPFQKSLLLLPQQPPSRQDPTGRLRGAGKTVLCYSWALLLAQKIPEKIQAQKGKLDLCSGHSPGTVRCCLGPHWTLVLQSQSLPHRGFL